ncbi:HutD family protein [Nordella sp. HKS 07]|uniref:HutD/Ves family protein n=1 Tax=Nordella sp. HKS 07 TaxID=2712222 RepID=UPI0013E132FC|nr:HutD family protein [Nordella sp. HKS 07]QIG47047.1 HutD family protein [Nordella sp. HKS 07]
MRLLRAEGYEAKPWKNGQGITRDILLWPATDEFDLRVSLADIPPASTFSAFPGITRHITRISGSATTLIFADGRVERLGLMTPLTFDSGEAPHCEASGDDVRVLNVMTRATSWRSSVRPLAAGRHPVVLAEGHAVLLFAVAGEWRVEAGNTSVNCLPGETLLAARPAAITLVGTAGCAALLADLVPAAESRDALFAFFEATGRN